MAVHDDETDEAVSRRLKLLREAMHFSTAASFAAYLGISDRRWNNFEVGKPLSREVAMLIVRKIPGISLDWLYRGRQEGLSFEMGVRLGEVVRPPGKARKVR
jgi:hypothetical protein